MRSPALGTAAVVVASDVGAPEAVGRVLSSVWRVLVSTLLVMLLLLVLL